MGQIRRTRYAFFYLDERWMPDVATLLAPGQDAGSTMTTVVALALLTGKRHELSRDAFELLRSLPADRWVSDGQPPAETVRELIDKGLLLSDADEEPARALRERDEALDANQWNLYAAAFHFMTQWGGVSVRESDEDEAAWLRRTNTEVEAFAARYGTPPPAFSDRPALDRRPLPRPNGDGPLFAALRQRRTTRAFDPDVPMTLEQLGAVLHHVFGAHGYAPAFGTGLFIKRTSPSGGCLHPTEAYPMISNVSDVTPGIYHYDVKNHALSLVAPLDSRECQSTATSFMCGQTYFGAAHVSFVLTARFFRSHWKYRRHQKAYPGILMDVAHLSQTLYLVAAQLGLGAFFTIAVNGRDIERQLELDGVSEGVIAMSGCGPRGPEDSPWEPLFSAQPPP